MKQLLSNDYGVLIVRLVLGFLFIIASIDKIANPQAFAQSIGHYELFPPVITYIIATILPWLELLCGFCIVFGVFIKGSTLTASILLGVFTIVVISALIRHLDISCGCFTLDPQTEKISGTKILENVILLALSVYLFFFGSGKFSLETYFKKLISNQ